MDPVVEVLKEALSSRPQLIGAEVERIGVSADGGILNYDSHIHPLLRDLSQESGWSVHNEYQGQVLAVRKDNHFVTLEPGAQFEISAAPQKSIHDFKMVQESLEADIDTLVKKKNWRWIELGLNPFQSVEQTPLLPSVRYQYMDRYFKDLKTRGREMMRLTAGFQVNLDFSTEQEAIKMLRVAFYISPVLSAVFSNSPYHQGRRSSNLSERHFIWKDTDPKRSGYPNFILEENLSFEVYSNYVRNIPLLYAYQQDGKVWDPENQKLDDLSGEQQKLNAVSALRQVFTEVRMKPSIIEIRCIDEQNNAYRYAVLAAFVGLLYNQANLDILHEKALKTKMSSLAELAAKGAHRGLNDLGLRKSAEELMGLAEKGLQERGLKEDIFLKPFMEIIQSGKTPAERLVSKMGETYQI